MSDYTKDIPFSFDESLIARKTEDGRTQSLQEHTESVAALASLFAKPFGAGTLAETTGIYHDPGKGTQSFQNNIRDESAKRGQVLHSIYGAKLAYDTLSTPSAHPLIAEIISNCILSHHGKLEDNIAPDGVSPLMQKLHENSEYEPFTGDFKAMIDTLSKTLLETHSKAMISEIKTIRDVAPDKPFALTMLTKLLYSCLVDADRLDAYLFESGKEYIPKPPDWSLLLSHLEAYLQKTGQNKEAATDITVLRESISMQCAAAGTRDIGIYQLSAPTGGGKTLSSLRFALTHAKKHGMSRIIYVIPYITITQQTASEIRKAVCTDIEDADEIILEHHSNILPDEPEYYKLHTDRWDIPIIITTQVQFLESVFSSRGSDLRKLHNMADSVIIFDEVQSLPVKCVHLFNSVLNFLNKICRSTILLCTATQPLLDKVERKLLMSDNPDIAVYDSLPERTRIINAIRHAGYSYPELADFILGKHNLSSLVIVNTKGAAKKLFDEFKAGDIPVMHLSTSMSPAHREEVINEMKKKLINKERFICISTQLIEAGIDISFECVFRDIAGLDSIFQAAGRCNRRRDFGGICNVYVVNIKGQDLSRLPDIKIGAEITLRLFDDNRELFDEEQELIDDSRKLINMYYDLYFYARKNEMDYPADGGSIHDLLTKNKQGIMARNNIGITLTTVSCSAIRSAADQFFVIAPGQTGIIAPRNDDERSTLEAYTKSSDLNTKRRQLRILGRYTISVYQFQLDELNKRRALFQHEGLWVLSKEFYDEFIGMNLDGSSAFLCI